ncbi:MAG: hypothetical protein ACP5D6_06330 [Kosmotogaceae bacterium]
MSITRIERETIKILVNEYSAWHGMRISYPDSPNFVDYLAWENEAREKLENYLSEITEEKDGE